MLPSMQGADLERPVEIWGEDALLQWPGARRPLIAERDAYMARTIWAAATGAHWVFKYESEFSWF